MVRVAVVKVKGDFIGYEVKEIQSSLPSYYKEIGCDLIDVVRDVNIGKSVLDIIVDDEGLLKDNPIASAVCVNAEQTLYGNLVICRSHEGNFTDLTDEDIQEIENSTYIRQDFMDNIQLPVLVYSYGEIK